jgi:HK97 family phage major capsid protein
METQEMKGVTHKEKIEELKAGLLDLNEQIQTIQALADSEERELSGDEEKQIKDLFDAFQDSEKEIERRERIIAQTEKLTASLGRQTTPQPIEPQNRHAEPSARREVPRIQLLEDRGKWGWKSMGEFAAAVRVASNNAGGVDPRLLANAPSTYSSEGTGADGGFAVPPDFRQAIVEKIMGEESLLARTDQMTTTSNSITFPKDETAAWDSTGGIQAYWEGEGSQLTQSKISLGEESLRLNKLTALIPVTEELMDDAPSLDSYLRRKVPEKFDYKLQDAILNGTGVGKPLGIMNSNSLVTVAKEGSQTADTVQYANVVKMWARMYAPCRSRSVWFINQDVETSLLQMAFDPAATAGMVPAYMPAGGASASPYGMLMGRPVIPIQAAQTLGNLGDIVLADMSQYMTVTKVGGVRQDVSIHLFFDYDMTAYRFIMRVGGKPWWGSAITPANSANTLSCFVTLAERA